MEELLNELEKLANRLETEKENAIPSARAACPGEDSNGPEGLTSGQLRFLASYYQSDVVHAVWALRRLVKRYRRIQ